MVFHGHDIARDYRVENHDARELQQHRFLGNTHSGTPAFIDERFVAADLRNEANLRSQTRASHRLIRTLAAEVHAITRAEHGFASAGNSHGFHGQSGRITADDRDARIIQ